VEGIQRCIRLLAMGDPGMIHCICGFTCGTKAALERHILRFGPDSKEHGRDPEPPSPLRAKKSSSSSRLRIDACGLDSPGLPPAVGRLVLVSPMLSVRSSMSTIPPSPMTPLSPQAPLTPLSPVSPASAGTGVRLLLVRHAQSANKCRRGRRAVADPELSDLGYEQAKALGKRLEEEFRTRAGRRKRLRVVSSPMRRCLLTIQPAVQMLGLPLDNCMCHGACYEYGCAGTSFMGSTRREIARDFPEFLPVGFNAEGAWDYAGSQAREDEPECRERAARVVRWLHELAEAEREAVDKEGGQTGTLILATHQTVADLLCHILIRGSADKWQYGEITHKLQNACITEVFLYPKGRACLGFKNEASHLMSLRFRNLG